MLDGSDTQRHARLRDWERRTWPRTVECGATDAARCRHQGRSRPPDRPGLAVVNAKGPRFEIDAGPREGADFTNSQPAPQHQQKHRAIAQPINHPEQLDEIIVAHRFGKALRDDHLMPALMNRLLDDQPPLVQEAKETVHDAQEVIDRRGARPLRWAARSHLDIGRRGGRQILIETGAVV